MKKAEVAKMEGKRNASKSGDKNSGGSIEAPLFPRRSVAAAMSRDRRPTVVIAYALPTLAGHLTSFTQR